MSMPTAEPHSDAGVPAPAGLGADVPLRFRDRVRLKHGSSEVLIFRVGAEWFGVEIQAVDEVLEAPTVRTVPDAPPSLLGVFHHGDEVLPLHTPSLLLGVTADSGGVALLMRSARRHIALAVDDVDDVVHVDLADLREPPHRDAADEIVAGVCWSAGRLVAVLDARALVGACLSPGGTGAP